MFVKPGIIFAVIVLTSRCAADGAGVGQIADVSSGPAERAAPTETGEHERLFSAEERHTRAADTHQTAETPAGGETPGEPATQTRCFVFPLYLPICVCFTSSVDV